MKKFSILILFLFAFVSLTTVSFAGNEIPGTEITNSGPSQNIKHTKKHKKAKAHKQRKHKHRKNKENKEREF